MPKDTKPKSKHYSEEELNMLKGVNKRLGLLADYHYQFRSGLLRGVGFAIGASIIGAIVVAAILSVLRNIDRPFIDEIINDYESINSSSSNNNE